MQRLIPFLLKWSSLNFLKSTKNFASVVERSSFTIKYNIRSISLEISLIRCMIFWPLNILISNHSSQTLLLPLFTPLLIPFYTSHNLTNICGILPLNPILYLAFGLSAIFSWYNSNTFLCSILWNEIIPSQLWTLTSLSLVYVLPNLGFFLAFYFYFSCIFYWYQTHMYAIY